MRNKYKGADIRARLGGTIIRYKGQPYHCEVEGEIVALHDIIDKRLIARVSPEDPQLDISSLTLGYFNIKDKAVYAARQPFRRYKQGVDIFSLTYSTAGAERTRFEADQMYCQGFIDGLNQKYPSLKMALKMLKDKTHSSVAISQEVAVVDDARNIKIYIKGEEAGWARIDRTEGVIKAIVPKNESSWVLKILLEYASKDWVVSEGVPND